MNGVRLIWYYVTNYAMGGETDGLLKIFPNQYRVKLEKVSLIGKRQVEGDGENVDNKPGKSSLSEISID